MSEVGKLLHKILSRCLEDYLKINDVIDTSVQKGFITGLLGVFEHTYTLTCSYGGCSHRQLSSYDEIFKMHLVQSLMGWCSMY